MPGPGRYHDCEIFTCETTSFKNGLRSNLRASDFRIGGGGGGGGGALLISRATQ